MDKLICKQCLHAPSFNDKLAYEKHNWEHHPTDLYQRYWSELKRSGKLETRTLGYQDNPYY